MDTRVITRLYILI